VVLFGERWVRLSMRRGGGGGGAGGANGGDRDERDRSRWKG